MSMPFGPVERVDNAKLEVLAGELAKQIKTEQDIAALSRQLLKLTVESALNAELTAHLGYDKHERSEQASDNRRNGHSRKTLKGDIGEMEIRTPRDRQGSFEPQLIRKGQTRLTEFDEQILALYAKGMSTRDIAATFEEMYGAEVSHGLSRPGHRGGLGDGADLAEPALGRGLPDRLPGRDRGQGPPG